MDLDFTFLSKEQACGEQRIKVLDKYLQRVVPTDFAILLGANAALDHIYINNKLSGDMIGSFFTLTADKDGNVIICNDYGYENSVRPDEQRGICARPVLEYSDPSFIDWDKVVFTNDIPEFEFGEFPQMAVSPKENNTIEDLYKLHKFVLTGEVYTTDTNNNDDDFPYLNMPKPNKVNFVPMKHEVYEYNGKKYVRVIANPKKYTNPRLSNGVKIEKGDVIWVEVQPIKWIIIKELKMIISIRGLFAGMKFNYDGFYDGNLENSDIKKYMDDDFSKEIQQSISLDKVSKEEIQKPISLDKVGKEEIPIKKESKLYNPYNFEFGEVSEEEILKGAIESCIAVFLHGQSSEGKSARVKQVDPEAEIVYLGTCTIDSLIGRSVYNSNTGEMIDIPPTWYINLQKKCEAEPDKIHLLFFEEITNAKPSIQGMAYDIILDRVINGKWKLPKNARVVAAGNDYKDSLAANQIAQPLFNRFAHVYIKTSVEDWLKWAITDDEDYKRLDYNEDKPKYKIHPAIYAYIAFKGEKALRSTYTGVKPNADPRKWEMASHLLYKTGKPEMLRSLVGEEITRDFIEFCNHQIITIQDVIDGKYSNEILCLPIDSKWAVTASLATVDDDNVEVVRNFVSKFGPELVSVFDSLWSYGNKKRMEKVLEWRLISSEMEQKQGGGIKK